LEAQTDASAPFAGIRVVEFGQFVAVPFAAQLLAEGGAHVIKIEALGGDPTRRLMPIAPGETRTFISRNRGKHSLPLKLNDPAARPVLDALLEHCDVALMNFRPGLAEKLGLDDLTLTKRYPRLIIGTVTAFGPKGPDSDHAGMDIVVQARTGLMAANGRVIDGRPAPGDPVSADYMCAMSLAFGVSAALLRRERTGQGGTVETSLMQAAMTLANNQLIRSEQHDGPKHQAVLDRLAQQRATGASYTEQLQGMSSNRAIPMLKVYFRTFETADADIAIACGSHSLREKFMAALGLDDPGLNLDNGDTMRGDHYDALAAKVEDLLRSRSSSQWLDVLQTAGVPVSTVRFPVEMFDDEQVAANNMMHTLKHPTAGDLKVLAPPVRLDEGGFAPAAATAALGSETDSILRAMGFDDDQIEALIAAGVTRRA
jgi:crotonobetainyl-CoA:carnitine CoA-transferase CaiB-like acyl-CoA transferase